MTTTKTKITSIVIAMLMLMTCFGIMAQSAQAKKGEYGGFFVWSECKGTTSDGVWKLKSKNKFTKTRQGSPVLYRAGEELPDKKII